MLKCVAQLGALGAGFAVSAFYDFQYTTSSDNPVLPFFGLATALTVGFQLNSCVLCSLMLSSVVKIGKSYVSEEEEAEYLWRLRVWAAHQIPGSLPPAPRRDFRRHWETRCEGRWRVAVAMFLAGIPTFFAVMGLAGYLKFQTSPATVIVTAVVMALAFIYTVAMNSDWAKSLLSGGAASKLPLGWQGGDAGPGSEMSPRTSPFAYHQVPDKDSAWPPPDPDAIPHNRTRLEHLPYPAILGLQPWPGNEHPVPVSEPPPEAAGTTAPAAVAPAAEGQWMSQGEKPSDEPSGQSAADADAAAGAAAVTGGPQARVGLEGPAHEGDGS